MADGQMLERYVVGLMKRVRDDAYPSSAQMDLIESLLPVEGIEMYLEILMEKIEAEQFPSIEMLKRVQRLAPLAG